jgi:hypothetical protein
VISASPRDFISRFLPPQRTTAKEISDSQFYMVLLEIGKSSRFSVHSTIALGACAHPTLPQTVSFLEITGTMLVAGGRGCLQFMTTRNDHKSVKLEMIGNQNSFRDLSTCTFTCALVLENAVFVGCAAGNIYRFVFDENGNFISEECGRLRQGGEGLGGKRIAGIVRKGSAGFLVFTACGRVHEWSRKCDARWTRDADHGKIFHQVASVKDISDHEVAILDGKAILSFSKTACSVGTSST